MAEQVIEQIAAFQTVAALHVRVEKPNAPLPHPGGLPVIEVEWHRN